MENGAERGPGARRVGRTDGDELRKTALKLARRPSLRLATRLANQRRRIRGHPPVGNVLESVQSEALRESAPRLLQETLDLAGQRSVRLATWIANLRLRTSRRPPMGSVLDPLIDTLLNVATPPAKLPRPAGPAISSVVAPAEAPGVDLVVLVTGEAGRLAGTLDALDEAASLMDGTMALVDDGADDQAMSLGARWAADRDLPLKKIERDPAPGQSQALRRAIEAGEAGAVLLVTAGAIPLPGACASLVRELGEDPSAVAISGLRVPTALARWVPAALAAAGADGRLGPGRATPIGVVRPPFCVLRRSFLDDNALAWFVRTRRRELALRELVTAAERSGAGVLQTASAAAVVDLTAVEAAALDPHEQRVTEVLSDLGQAPERTAPILETALGRPMGSVAVASDTPWATAMAAGLRTLGLRVGEPADGVIFASDPDEAQSALRRHAGPVVLYERGMLGTEPSEELATELQTGRLRATAPTRLRERSLEELGWRVAGLVPVHVPRSVFQPREDDPFLGAVRCVVVRRTSHHEGSTVVRSLAEKLGPGVAVLTLGPPPTDAELGVALTHRAEADLTGAAAALGAADLFVDLGDDDLCGTWTARALACGTPALAVSGSSGAELVRSEPALVLSDVDAVGGRLKTLLGDHHELVRLRRVAETIAEQHGDLSIAARLIAVAVLP